MSWNVCGKCGKEWISAVDIKNELCPSCRISMGGITVEDTQKYEVEGLPHDKQLERHLITSFIKIIQRLEREGIDLTVDDMRLVKRAKTYLGYSVPETIEGGTGMLIGTP